MRVVYTIEDTELEPLKARFIAANAQLAAAQDIVRFIAEREGLSNVSFDLETGVFSSEEEEKKED